MCNSFTYLLHKRHAKQRANKKGKIKQHQYLHCDELGKARDR